MSRIGNSPVKILDGVEAKIADNVIEIKGKKGSLSTKLPQGIKIDIADGEISFKPANENTKNNGKVKALWGLSRALVNNMVVGVTEGFTKKLEINGVGYKAQVQGRNLKLDLGFSHEVLFPIPEGIEIKAPKQTELEISGIDKQLVGQVSAEIREYRKPEPYKGKGIRYSDEYVRRKEGKKK